MKEDMRMDENMDDTILGNLASLIAERVLLFFEDEENQREFEKYYYEKYHRKYHGQRQKEDENGRANIDLRKIRMREIAQLKEFRE